MGLLLVTSCYGNYCIDTVARYSSELQDVRYYLQHFGNKAFRRRDAQVFSQQFLHSAHIIE